MGKTKDFSTGTFLYQKDTLSAIEIGGNGHRRDIKNDDRTIPIVVVQGTPYEMGYHLGSLMKEEIQRFVPKIVLKFKRQLHISGKILQKIWSITSAYTDNRFEQELIGLAEGSETPLEFLQALHCFSLLMPYSCSSVAVWGKATEDGHLYQTRDLDWDISTNAHEFPCIVAYFPEHGFPHVIPTFAGMIGANTGINAKGLVLTEMGDSPEEEMPYYLYAPHFTSFFRTILYDASSLSQTLEIFESFPKTKRYHYVFGDGQVEKRSVKICANNSEVSIWNDNDPTDEFAPNVLSDVVYNDEGRDAFSTIKNEYGNLNAEKMIALANKIAMHGSNVLNVVYDATTLKVWISYAHGDREAFQRPYFFVDLNLTPF
ncbi:MAG: C45 family peptidase [Thermotogae bacterium]|jgi:hypothetical protein|nr:C45 family peptidase [Thermotogota bacterium]MCL5033111.1 C45 family peptidase [Thermotogota bacterium]